MSKTAKVSSGSKIIDQEAVKNSAKIYDTNSKNHKLHISKSSASKKAIITPINNASNYIALNHMHQIMQYGIVGFWALWTLLVSASDLINLLQKLHMVPDSLHFTSNNYTLVAQTLSIYGLDTFTITIVVFTIINVMVFLAAVAFLRAFIAGILGSSTFIKYTYIAFIVSFALEGFFILADEVFIQYSNEHGHVIRLAFRLITFIVFMMVSRKLDIEDDIKLITPSAA